MKPNKLLLLVGLLASLGAAPVYASVSASASFSDFSVTLYDLDPSDGVTPKIIWGGGYLGSYTSASVGDGVGGSGSSWKSTLVGVENTSTVSLENVSAVASVGGASAPKTPSGSLSASGNASATETGGTASFNAFAQESYFGYGYNFTLSANTLVVFKATATVGATTTVGFDQSKGGTETAYASADMHVYGGNGFGGNQSNSDRLGIGASYSFSYQWDPVTNTYVYSYTPQSIWNSAQLSTAFVNSSSTKQTGYLQMSTSVSGYTSIAAVPEPESYAMFMAGLGLVGAVVRRRRPVR